MDLRRGIVVVPSMGPTDWNSTDLLFLFACRCIVRRLQGANESFLYGSKTLAHIADTSMQKGPSAFEVRIFLVKLSVFFFHVFFFYF